MEVALNVPISVNCLSVVQTIKSLPLLLAAFFLQKNEFVTMNTFSQSGQKRNQLRNRFIEQQHGAQ